MFVKIIFNRGEERRMVKARHGKGSKEKTRRTRRRVGEDWKKTVKISKNI